eukprot:SAG11_NODE_36399_length_261_cov_3.129630_1_plen_47_part_01
MNIHLQNTTRDWRDRDIIWSQLEDNLFLKNRGDHGHDTVKAGVSVRK